MNHIKRFEQISIDDIDTVGGKNASLGEMYSSLSGLGVKVPNGFAITTDAFRYYIEHNGLNALIRQELDACDFNDPDELSDIGGKIRASIVHGEMPADLREEIVQAYGELGRQYGQDKPDVAVRSSATSEDLPNLSFAGQQDTYLNIAGTRNLISTCQWVFASLYTDRAIAYRHKHGLSHVDIALAVAVQKMVRSDLAASGVMFTLDTESGFRDAVFITSAYGLGENIVQGAVNPDEFYVFKPTLKDDYRPIVKRRLGSKEIKMIYAAEHLAGIHTKNVPVHPEDRDCFSISDDDVVTLARYAVTIESHYSHRHRRDTPMDIEWAKDGHSGELYVVQARPETVHKGADDPVHEHYRLIGSSPVVTHGKSVGRRIASGSSRVILEALEMDELQAGEILVTDIIDPDWEPVMQRAAGIVTNRGGRSCHAAIIARELGIPAIVGCNDATIKIHDGQALTLSCAEGDTGFVYEGRLDYDKRIVDLRTLPETRTRVMVNLRNPEQAFDAAFLPAAGVGLTPLESITRHSIGVHPRALIEFEKLGRELRLRIESIIGGYHSPRDFFVQRLAEGIATVAAAFYPRPVILRTSDYRSDSGRQLLGGDLFEPDETNPALGLRGAARYLSEEFAACFELECEAINSVRTDKGLDNIALAIPFVRTLEQARLTQSLMASHGLIRGDRNLAIYLMCELPGNALRADEYLQHFDGLCIDADMLSDFTLATDHPTGSPAEPGDCDMAVLDLLDNALRSCRRHAKFAGLCGNSLARFPGLARYLIERGVESLSVDSEHFLTEQTRIAAIERELAVNDDSSGGASPP